MKAKFSPLQVKEVVIKRCRVEENLSGVHKQIVDLDFQAGTAERDGYILILTLNFNKNAKNPMLKAEVEAHFLFQVDPDLSEEEKAKLLVYNGLAIAYGMIRGMIFQRCCMLPPKFRILPSVNLIPLIEAKIKEKAEAKEE